MKKLFIALSIAMIALQSNAQSFEKKYKEVVTETIFSFGDIKASAINSRSIVRFSSFYHFQRQNHHNFNNHFGIYSGLGLRNVGFINEFNDSLKVKQRSYSLGIPLAIKLGNMQSKAYIALGAEIEWMFAYKQKVYYNDEKKKFSEWFSNRVTPINPSLFVELHTSTGQYIRFKYYLQNFLQTDNQKIYANNALLNFKPTTSQLMYVSIGTNIPKKMMKGRKAKRANSSSAQL